MLVINGPVGIGKSSAAEAVSRILAEKYALSHALVDLDDIRSAFPRPQNDPFHMSLGFKNLAAIWPNYREAGARCLIVPSVMEHASDLDQVRSAVPGALLFVVRLTASLKINHDRIRGRETGAESLVWHLNRSTQLAVELEASRLEDCIIETDQKTAVEVAREILGRWEVLDPAFGFVERS